MNYAFRLQNGTNGLFGALHDIFLADVVTFIFHVYYHTHLSGVHSFTQIRVKRSYETFHNDHF